MYDGIKGPFPSRHVTASSRENSFQMLATNPHTLLIRLDRLMISPSVKELTGPVLTGFHPILRSP